MEVLEVFSVEFLQQFLVSLSGMGLWVLFHSALLPQGFSSYRLPCFFYHPPYTMICSCRRSSHRSVESVMLVQFLRRWWNLSPCFFPFFHPSRNATAYRGLSSLASSKSLGSPSPFLCPIAFVCGCLGAARLSALGPSVEDGRVPTCAPILSPVTRFSQRYTHTFLCRTFFKLSSTSSLAETLLSPAPLPPP